MTVLRVAMFTYISLVAVPHRPVYVFALSAFKLSKLGALEVVLPMPR